MTAYNITKHCMTYLNMNHTLYW